MFKILFVCTGNICRSPTAEAVMRQKIRGEGLDHILSCDSAGTHGYHIGEGPDSRSCAFARRRGIFMEDLRARKISDDDFYHFDLILAMDQGHYAILARRKPADAKAQIAMFCDYAQDSVFSDVPDPYYGGSEGFETVLDIIEKGVGGLLSDIRKTLGI